MSYRYDMKRLLCWLGLHRWRYDYGQPMEDMPERECWRCCLHQVVVRAGWIRSIAGDPFYHQEWGNV
jgi:hypothetical protein